MRARPAGPAQSSALHDFARSGPTKEAHRWAIYSSGGLLRSVAGPEAPTAHAREVALARRRLLVPRCRYYVSLRQWRYCVGNAVPRRWEMASLTARRIGPLVCGLLVGALGAVAWAARRQPPARGESPPPANRPPGPSGPSGGPPPAPPPARRRATARIDLWAFLGLSVAVAIAGVLAYLVVRPPS
jgi:hypothetical protein